MSNESVPDPLRQASQAAREVARLDLTTIAAANKAVREAARLDLARIATISQASRAITETFKTPSMGDHLKQLQSIGDSLKGFQSTVGSINALARSAQMVVDRPRLDAALGDFRSAAMASQAVNLRALQEAASVVLRDSVRIPSYVLPTSGAAALASPVLPKPTMDAFIAAAAAPPAVIEPSIAAAAQEAVELAETADFDEVEPYVDSVLAHLTPEERAEHWDDVRTAIGALLIIAGSVTTSGVNAPALGEVLIYLVLLLRIYRRLKPYLAMREREPMLGELQAAGELDAKTMALFDETLGDWRALTLEEAGARIGDDLAASRAAGELERKQLDRIRESSRIVEAFLAKSEAGRVHDDTVVAEVVRELYGDSPTQEQLDIVLDVEANFRRAKRGEPPVRPGD